MPPSNHCFHTIVQMLVYFCDEHIGDLVRVLHGQVIASHKHVDIQPTTLYFFLPCAKAAALSTRFAPRSVLLEKRGAYGEQELDDEAAQPLSASFSSELQVDIWKH